MIVWISINDVLNNLHLTLATFKDIITERSGK